MITTKKNGIGTYTSSPVTNGKLVTLGHEAEVLTWNKQILQERQVIDRGNPTKDIEITNQAFDLWLSIGARAAFSFDNLMNFFYERHGKYTAFYNAIDEEARKDIREYLTLISEITGNLWTCRKKFTGDRNFIMESSFVFDKAHELFLTENVETYKRIAQILSSIGEKTLMPKLNTLLLAVFDLSYLCIEEYQRSSPGNPLSKKALKIERESRNVGLILEHENKRLKNRLKR